MSRPVRRLRVPTVLQNEAVECGAAALAMVLAWHGRPARLTELRPACGVSRDGSRAGDLLRAAAEYGLSGRGLRAEPEQLADLPLPAILFVGMNHFVVLEGVGAGGFFINDPATGPRRVEAEEFDGLFTGIVLVFEPLPGFQSSRGFGLLSGFGGRPSGAGAPVGGVGALASWLAGVRRGFIYVVVVSLWLVVPGLVVPAYTRLFVDDYLIGGHTDWLGGLFAAMAATALVQGGLTWLRRHVLDRLETRLAVAAAARFTARLLELPADFFAMRFAGTLSARLAGTARLAQMAGANLAGLVFHGVTLLAFTALMVRYSPPLTLAVVLISALNLTLFLRYRRQLADDGRTGARAQLRLGAKTLQGLGLIETLKAAGTEGAFFESWTGILAGTVNSRQEMALPQALLGAVPRFLGQLGGVVVLTLGGFLVMEGRMTLGMLVAYHGLLESFARPLEGLIESAIELQEAPGQMEQLADVEEAAPAPEFLRLPVAETASSRPDLGPHKLEGAVSLQGLTFGYNRRRAPAIAGIGLDLAPGARVALVGGSGSGKSTIGRLVAGLYEPWAGAVRLDGRPLSDIPRPLLRRSVAVVDQDILLFRGSVRDNITLWDASMPDERVVRAAKDALIHEDIVERPGGYDALVEENGRNFSGGQRQRIEIARALVGEPSLLVLDEATSALDPLVELAVMDNLRRRGCTCLIVAHRLSTIRDCDEIVVLDGGRVVERGPHAALAQAGGPYQRLIEA